jgi:hypothetical protein
MLQTSGALQTDVHRRERIMLEALPYAWVACPRTLEHSMVFESS